jgi:hypothetical protein
VTASVKGKEKELTEEELKNMKLAELRELTKNLPGFDAKKRTKKFYIDLYLQPTEVIVTETVEVEPGVEEVMEGEVITNDFAVSNWVVIGDLETVFKFVKPFESLEQFVDQMPAEGKRLGYARLELDPLCEGNQCGKNAIVIAVDAANPILSAQTKVGGNEITLGDPSMERTTLVDFIVDEWMVIADLIGFMAAIDAYDTYEDLRETQLKDDMRIYDEDNATYLFKNTERQASLMDANTPTGQTGEYSSFKLVPVS